MSNTEREKRKRAYLSAVSLAEISPATLKKLHNVSDNVIDKYLYVSDRYPTFQACYELWLYINKTGRPVSRKLNQLIVDCEEKAEKAIS